MSTLSWLNLITCITYTYSNLYIPFFLGVGAGVSTYLNVFDCLATRRNRFAATAPCMAFLNLRLAFMMRNPETMHGVSITLSGSVNHGCVITSWSTMRCSGSPISIFYTSYLAWGDI